MTIPTWLFMALLSVSVLVPIACAVIFAVSAHKKDAKLMWFHNAGQGMAQHELEKARLDVQRIQAESAGKRAEADAVMARADVSIKNNIHNASGSRRFGGEVRELETA